MMIFSSKAQETKLEYFISEAKMNFPVLKENYNLQKIGEIQNNIIIAQNKAFQINATSEVQVAPYFNNNGRFIDVTTTPSPRAYGYDVGITNGGLYFAQLNVNKNLFNQKMVDNLLFQNKVQNNTLSLSAEDIEHNLVKNITDAYIMAYQLQLQKNFTIEILTDLDNRLKVVELLVKRAVLMESDYLLLQLDIDSKKLELQQIGTNLKTAIDQLYSLSGIPLAKTDSLSVPNILTAAEPETNFYQRKFQSDSLQVQADRNVFENQYKPQLSLYGNTGLNAVELTNIDRRVGLSAGLRLIVPIYDGKQRKYNAQLSELKKENLEFYKENAAIQLENNLKSIEAQLSALEENMQAIEEQLQKQQNVLEIYKGKLVQGQVSIVDYLNVIQTYKLNVQTKLQMQTNRLLLQSQYNFINW
ncbi:TolC family protein [Zobellia barbeyronii]|uniref:TolC family protein n=1 Tax=Zobellia barbeyronii TaxID=2748009 RepID=A0ABS5WEM7_9FLAO|nr:TolC family protein [Zobellia barbeyronii]MBT2161290.1 TolC family protein [Zobellia barbeyronii]